MTGAISIPQFECSECGATKPEKYRLTDHIQGAHGADDPERFVIDSERDISERTLEALYKLNKHAKKYARLADENYRKGKGAPAKANSCKKEALYSVKDRVLQCLVPGADRVERHVIDGDEYYCLYFSGYSFHTPVPDDGPGPYDELVDATRTLEDFEADEKVASDMSLKASLLLIEESFEICVNRQLPQRRVQYPSESYFVGWDYLTDAP